METEGQECTKDMDVMRNIENECDELLKKIIEFRFTDPEKVLAMCLTLYEISMEREDYYHAAIAKFYEGDAYLTLDNLPKASEILLQSIKMLKKYGFNDYLGKSYNVIAAVFYSQGDYVLAMKYFINALEIATEEKDYQTQAFINNNIAAVFLLYNYSKQAHSFFEKAWAAREHCEKSTKENHYSLTRMHLNLGICLNEEGKYAEAKKNLEEVLFEVTNEEFESISLYVWEFAASLSENMGEEDKAIGFARKYAEDAKIRYNSSDLNTCWESLRVLIKHRFFDEARELLELITDSARKNESEINELSILRGWIDYYDKLGDTESLNRTYKKYYDNVRKNQDQDYKDQVEALENRSLLTSMIDEKETLLKGIDQFEKISTIDPLTQLLNRNGMKHFTESILTDNKKNEEMINIAIIDLDHFKECNDVYGHLTGDHCLQAVAEAIKEYETDKIKGVRFGGDEFFLVGDGIKKADWEALIEKLLKGIRETVLLSEEQEIVKLTASIGVFSAIPKDSTVFLDYIHFADQALYKVKQSGRNGYFVSKEE